jgi:hypothetical protein
VVAASDPRSAVAGKGPSFTKAGIASQAPAASAPRSDRPEDATALPLSAMTPPGPAPSDRAPVVVPAGRPTAAPDTSPAAPSKQGIEVALGSALPASALAAPTAQMAAHAAPATNAAPAPAFEAQLAAALDSPAFAPALATQVSWLVNENVQLARLTLNPAEMGPVTVKIALDGTQARVDFNADMASTRAAIEASLPTLAAALHDSGLTLAGGGVSDGQSRHGAQGERSAPMPGPSAATAAMTPLADTPPAAPVRAARGLVDLVA